MKKLLTLGLVLFLTGCAPTKMMSMKQNSCESQFSKFEDVVSCTKEAYKKDGMARENGDTKLYFLKGDQLVQKLKNGEITEIDARTEWQSMYVDLKHKAVIRANTDKDDAPYQRSKYCAPSGGGGYVCY